MKECNLSKIKLVVLVSGGGSNLQAIMDAIGEGSLKAEITCVISNRKKTYGLERASNANIPIYYQALKPYKEDGRGRIQYDLDLADYIKNLTPDLVLLAGWMHILSSEFLDRLGIKVINLHPALPDTFAGTHAIERAYEAYQRGEIDDTGCMIHEVIPEVDAGKVILQAKVPIHPDDSLAELEARMHMTEHRLIVYAIRQIHDEIDS